MQWPRGSATRGNGGGRRWEGGSPMEGRARTIASTCDRIGAMGREAHRLWSGAIGIRDVDALDARNFPRQRKRRVERDRLPVVLQMLRQVVMGKHPTSTGLSGRRVGAPDARSCSRIRGGKHLEGSSRRSHRPPETREVAVALRSGGNPRTRDAAASRSPSSPVAYVPHRTNPRQKGAKTWSGGRCGRP